MFVQSTSFLSPSKCSYFMPQRAASQPSQRVLYCWRPNKREGRGGIEERGSRYGKIGFLHYKKYLIPRTKFFNTRSVSRKPQKVKHILFSLPFWEVFRFFKVWSRAPMGKQKEHFSIFWPRPMRSFWPVSSLTFWRLQFWCTHQKEG